MLASTAISSATDLANLQAGLFLFGFVTLIVILCRKSFFGMWLIYVYGSILGNGSIGAALLDSSMRPSVPVLAVTIPLFLVPFYCCYRMYNRAGLLITFVCNGLPLLTLKWGGQVYAGTFMLGIGLGMVALMLAAPLWFGPRSEKWVAGSLGESWWRHV